MLLICVFVAPAVGQDGALGAILTEHSKIIQKGSRKSIQPAIDALAGSGLPEAAKVLELWRAKKLWARKADGQFFLTETDDKKTYRLIDILSGEVVGEAAKNELKNIKPNSGIRGLISAALVQFQLSDPDIEKRRAALEAIQRDPAANQVAPLKASIAGEEDPELLALKTRLTTLLTARFADESAERVAAISELSGDLGLDARATLASIVAVKIVATEGKAPSGNIARAPIIGEDIPTEQAASILAKAGLAPKVLTAGERKAILAANILDGKVGGVPVADLSTQNARDRAFAALAEAGIVEAPTAATPTAKLYEVYSDNDAEVTSAAEAALASIDSQVTAFTLLDLSLDGLSLASIYVLAAIGLAVTFGVMGVINMAHGEFIMMGAYTGYVVQLFVPDYTTSLIVALPLAFAVGFGAGVAMERLVIRWLYDRPLETLLATFGVSIALQQIAKNVFGTQARPLTSPDWLDGALVINEVVSISWIRVAIIVLSIGFLALLWFIMNRTRLGLEVRAVTQNPRMAASMGIDPDYIRMMTFGLGSGIAGIAGVAIGLFAKVTSGLGQDYIVQSFMTVVVGGVGNLFGVLAGAGLVGAMQKGIEYFNPSNTLAAQTYMIVFIIIFIPFRPTGIFALNGRAAGD
ncbi:MAG: urea ABC transporter permease subunit UrtB [Pseudomonadota bacterium]